MAIGKIEKTGISVRRGKVQLRFSFYLDPTDARYDEHHVQVPVIPEGGYPGKVDAEGTPIDSEDFSKWIEGLPKKWQNNPFHNHFVWVSPDATDNEIEGLMRDSLAEFYSIWSRGEDILRVWKAKREAAGDMSPYKTDGNSFIPRDYATLGNVASGWTEHTGLSIGVVTGDYIGIYFE